MKKHHYWQSSFSKKRRSWRIHFIIIGSISFLKLLNIHLSSLIRKNDLYCKAVWSIRWLIPKIQLLKEIMNFWKKGYMDSVRKLVCFNSDRCSLSSEAEVIFWMCPAAGRLRPLCHLPICLIMILQINKLCIIIIIKDSLWKPPRI